MQWNHPLYKQLKLYVFTCCGNKWELLSSSKWDWRKKEAQFKCPTCGTIHDGDRMATTLTGTVTSKSRNGTGIQLNNDKGTWYNGTTDQLMSVAWKSEVSMEVDDKNKIISITPTGAAPAPAANQQAATTYTNTENKRQEVIVFQSARNAAIDLFRELTAAEAIKLPTKQADKYAAAMAFINEHTVMYHNEAMKVYAGTPAEEVLNVE